jgi:hypothetical protein
VLRAHSGPTDSVSFLYVHPLLLAAHQVVPTPWGMVPAVPAGMPPMWMPRPGMMPGMAMPYRIAYQQVRVC